MHGIQLKMGRLTINRGRLLQTTFEQVSPINVRRVLSDMKSLDIVLRSWPGLAVGTEICSIWQKITKREERERESLRSVWEVRTIKSPRKMNLGVNFLGQIFQNEKYKQQTLTSRKTYLSEKEKKNICDWPGGKPQRSLCGLPCTDTP